MRQTLSQMRQELGLHSVGLSFVLLALSGCGGGDDSSTSTASSDPSSSTPAAPAASSGDSAAPGSSDSSGGAMHGGSGGMHGSSGGMAEGSGDSSGESAATGEGDSSGSSGAASGMHGSGGSMLSGAPGGMGSGMMAGGSSGMHGAMPGGAMPGGAMPGGAMPGGAMSGGVAGPPKSTRPTDFSKWTDDDFHNAVRERDETVLKAIDARTAAKPADAGVATLLTALLVTSAEAPAVSSGDGSNPGEATGDPDMAMPGGDSSSSAPAAGSSAPGMHGAPQNGAPNGRPKFQRGGGSGNGSSAAPTSWIQPRKAVDSIELMLLESATAYQQASGRPSFQRGGGGGGGASSGAGMHGSEGMSGGDRRDSPNSGMPAGSMPGMPGMSAGLGGGPRQGNLDVRDLTRNLIDNLVKNGSPVAWQTIFAVASGTMQTAVDQAEATQMVAESLLLNLESGGPQVEQVMLAILEGKAQVPPVSRSVFLATMAAVSSSASDKFTGFDKVLAPSPAAPGGFGMAPGMGSGLGSGMPMAGAGDAGATAGIGSESGFGAPGGFASGGPAAPPAGPAAVSISLFSNFSDSELNRAAMFLWSPKCVTAVADQLKAAADPMAASELLTLAAAIPNQKTREAMYSALSKVHSLGAEMLRGTGVFNQIHDPGLLVVLKTLPRPKATRAEAQTMDSWSATNEELVLALRDKMKALSTQPGKLTAVNDNFPVKLHRNAISEYAGVLTLPGTSTGDLKDSAPSQTKVYYARTSFTPQKPKDQNDIKEHYEARASGVTRPDQAKQLLWIDGVKGGTTGVRRTMDVIIQAKSAGGGGFGGPGGESGFGGPPGGGFGGASGAAGQGGAYSIEIIVVETADPKGSTTAAAESKPEKN